MANNNTFNTSEFLKGAYFAPIQLGKHEVTIGKVRAVVEQNEAGDDASYISATLTFENGREITPRFYNIGAKIFCDQIRQQLNDTADYKTINDFFKALEGKKLDMWVSKRTYTNKNDEVKSTLQYDFIEPAEDADEEIA